MSQTKPILGYGYSLEGREAAWKELEAGLPARGPNCPRAADLLEFALEQVHFPAEETRLRAHVFGCAICKSRLEVQQQAVQQAESLRASPPAATLQEQVAAAFLACRRPRWAGAVQPAPRKLATDNTPSVINHQVTLSACDDRVQPSLIGFLQWTSPDSEPKNPWYVTLRLPLQASDPMAENAEAALEELTRHIVRLIFLSADRRPGLSLETQLEWDEDHKELISHPQRVPIADPQTITGVELSHTAVP
jgi:hypothetical protein